MELASFSIWMVMPPDDLRYLHKHLEDVSNTGRDEENRREALHPYLGWVFDPDFNVPDSSASHRLQANSLGFVDDHSSLRRRSPDQFIIGVLGGSVAQHVTTVGEAALRARLAQCPELKGREIQIVRLAMAGYKQPQQLIALNYVLALGGEFDLVVNIDGYNETALAASENALHDRFFAYPTAWDVRLQDVIDPRTSSVSYRLLESRARRQEWARTMIHSGLLQTWTGSLIWIQRDVVLRRTQLRFASELRDHKLRFGQGFVHQGPAQKYGSPQEIYDQVTALWQNSSLQIHHVCQGRGIPYLHFLQPNQYYADSKPLSQIERTDFYAPAEDFAVAVKECYPRLVTLGGRLKEQGVAFHDATQLFAGISDTIYCDYFCHYNKRGNELLATAVAEEIANQLNRAPSENRE